MHLENYQITDQKIYKLCSILKLQNYLDFFFRLFVFVTNMITKKAIRVQSSTAMLHSCLYLFKLETVQFYLVLRLGEGNLSLQLIEEEENCHLYTNFTCLNMDTDSPRFLCRPTDYLELAVAVGQQQDVNSC